MSEWGESPTIDSVNAHIKSFLSVDQEVFEDGSNKEYPAIIKYTIKNTRPVAESPKIIYEEIELIVGTPTNKQVERIGKLECGQSVEYEYRCRYSEIPFVEHELRGKVLPQELFRFEVKPVPKRNSRLSVQSYISTINELDIHRWLRNIPNTILIPAPNTTISQLSDEKKRLEGIITEIGRTVEVLDRFLSILELPATSTFREPLIKHRNQVKEYLREVQRGIAGLRDSYKEQPSSNTQIRLDSMVKSLTPLAELLDKETDKLKALK